jgi:hypothetical protein
MRIENVSPDIQNCPAENALWWCQGSHFSSEFLRVVGFANMEGSTIEALIGNDQMSFFLASPTRVLLSDHHAAIRELTIASSVGRIAPRSSDLRHRPNPFSRNRLPSHACRKPHLHGPVGRFGTTMSVSLLQISNPTC